MKFIRQVFSSDAFLLDVVAWDMQSIFRVAIDHAIKKNLLTEQQRILVEKGLREREQRASTAIGHAVAVPHCYLDELTEPLVIFVRLARPLNFGAPDGIPTRYVFLLLGPRGATAEHLDTLAGIARLMSDDEFRFELRMASNGQTLLRALDHFLDRTAPPIPAEKSVPGTFNYTGHLFGGVVQDIRRRLPHYLDDFRDGIHAKSVASVLFLFFACLAPAVTFGGIMAELTGNHIGAVEMIIASAFCGVLFALFAGQPLIILGGTGPMLIFTWLLYVLCGQFGLAGHFLEVRALVGVWAAIILIILAATDAGCLMRYFTRFTDEIFAALISIIFIFTAIEALVHIVTEVYQTETTSHDKALVPLLLALGTFFIALNLSGFRRSSYLLPTIRDFSADFGPAIALAVMTSAALFWFHDVGTESLPAPDSIRPTMDRAWLINPFATPKWVWMATAVPGALAAILVFLDQNITARLINSPDSKLQKGEAYHYDLAIMSVLVCVCSLLGLPWLVAATVRSINHLKSLAIVDEVVSKTGTIRRKVVRVLETRITGLAIHLLIGLSILALPYLKMIPMSVLYGLFLYMGIVSISGNQLFDRMKLWLTDPALYPSTHYIRRVPLMTIHKFTLLQVVCLVILGVVEVTPLGILFPLFIVLLVPVRMMAGRFFNSEHLEALDADEIPDEEEMRNTE